jgi:hypothetical protein
LFRFSEDFSGQFNARCWKASHVQVLKLFNVYPAVWIICFFEQVLKKMFVYDPVCNLGTKVSVSAPLYFFCLFTTVGVRSSYNGYKL